MSYWSSLTSGFCSRLTFVFRSQLYKSMLQTNFLPGCWMWTTNHCCCKAVPSWYFTIYPNGYCRGNECNQKYCAECWHLQSPFNQSDLRTRYTISGHLIRQSWNHFRETYVVTENVNHFSMSKVLRSLDPKTSPVIGDELNRPLAC